MTGDTGLLTWQIDIPLINNRFMLWDSAKVITIAGAVMWAVVALMSLIVSGEPLFLPLTFVALIMAIVCALFFVACLILLNRWGFTNTLTEEGVGYTSGGREKGVNRALAVFGFLALLSGKPGPLGGALIAGSQEDGFYPWSDLYRVDVHPGPRVISLRNSWRVVHRLYCTPETYAQAVAICERKVAEAVEYRAAHPVERARLPWGRWALWALACVGAFACAMAWEGSRADTLGIPLLGAAAALLAAGVLEGAPRRVCGVVALVVAAWFVYATIADGLQPALPDFVAAGLSSPPVYSGEEAPFALSIIGGSAIALLAAWRAFGAATPRRRAYR
jgi:predicted anti-sigma-YlaC factor YlaD